MKLHIILITLLVIQFGVVLLPTDGYSNPSRSEINIEDKLSTSELSRFSCSIFTVEYNGITYFGGNEDEGGLRKNTEVRFIPSNVNTYGCALFGFVDNEPGGNDADGLGISGINEKGLCFDANGIPPGTVTPFPEGVYFANLAYWEFILKECSNVSEVIDWYKSHDMGGWWYNQIHWADSTGEAVVISPNGTVAFTEKREEEFFLISTNFNLANPSTGDYPCDRYTKVNDSLSTLINHNNISIDNLKLILESVHTPGTEAYIGTAYTHIFNLNTCEMYIYILGNYDEVLHLNLTEELAQGAHSYKLTDGLIKSLASKTSPGFNLLLILLWIIPLVYWRKRRKSNN